MCFQCPDATQGLVDPLASDTIQGQLKFAERIPGSTHVSRTNYTKETHTLNKNKCNPLSPVQEADKFRLMMFCSLRLGSSLQYLPFPVVKRSKSATLKREQSNWKTTYTATDSRAIVAISKCVVLQEEEKNKY